MASGRTFDEVRAESHRGEGEEVQTLRESRTPKGRLRTTDVVVQANDEIWPDDPARAVATKGLWQAGSGDAHALGWSILTRGYEMTPLQDGMGQFVGNPSMLDVANAYFCAFDFVAFGFHRLFELGSAQEPAQ